MNLLDNIIGFLSGKKTYLVALVAAVLNLCVAAGWVSLNDLAQVNAVLAALGGAALRSGVNKS
jgi:hypothetical protein